MGVLTLRLPSFWTIQAIIHRLDLACRVVATAQMAVDEQNVPIRVSGTSTRTETVWATSSMFDVATWSGDRRIPEVCQLVAVQWKPRVKEGLTSLAPVLTAEQYTSASKAGRMRSKWACRLGWMRPLPAL